MCRRLTPVTPMWSVPPCFGLDGLPLDEVDEGELELPHAASSPHCRVRSQSWHRSPITADGTSSSWHQLSLEGTASRRATALIGATLKATEETWSRVD